jgi:hypothetical protein
MCDQSGSGRRSHLISLAVSLVGNEESLSAKHGEPDINYLLSIFSKCIKIFNLNQDYRSVSK